LVFLGVVLLTIDNDEPQVWPLWSATCRSRHSRAAVRLALISWASQRQREFPQ